MSKAERNRLAEFALDPDFIFNANNPVTSVDVLGLFKGIEACCMIWATGDPTDLILINAIRQVASETANSLYDTPGDRNAFRHCLGACMLTREFGPVDAHEIEECHEKHGNSSSDGCSGSSSGGSSGGCGGDADTAADRHNNGVGNDIGTDPEASCLLGCQQALEDGDLVIYPPNPLPGP